LAAAPSEIPGRIKEQRAGRGRAVRERTRRKKFNLTNILMYQVQLKPKIYDLLTEQAEQHHQDWDVMSAENSAEQVHPRLYKTICSSVWQLNMPTLKYATMEAFTLQLNFWSETA